jgi:hypothetical protein
MISQAELKELLRYDKLSGIFYWRVFCGPRALVNKPAGSLDKHGYCIIKLRNKQYKAHRLAWLYVNGYIDDELEIDHKNRIRSDNRIDNLRLVDKTLNQQNRSLQENNTSGIKGVYFNKECNKWSACINVNKKRIYFGLFTNKEDAIIARLAAENIYFKGEINEILRNSTN